MTRDWENTRQQFEDLRLRLDRETDYEQEAVEAAPAPVLVDPLNLPKIDIGSILLRTPKYEDQGSPTWNAGQALFANSMQVKWSDNANQDLMENHGLNTVMPQAPVAQNMVGLVSNKRVKNIAKVGKVRRK